MTPRSDALMPLLSELRAVAPADSAFRIDELERRLSSSVLRVLVVGEAKRGKSTLLNALVGRDVLPTGVVPVTAVATTLRADADERVVARFDDGSVRTRPLSALADLVTEHGNPANRLGVRDVEVRLDAAILDGAELVDTPGVGSVHAHNTAEAEAALDDMDAAVFVLTADPPISASERDFLHSVRGRTVRLFCVLNKADRLDRAQLQESLDFTRQILTRDLGTDVAVFPLSARRQRLTPGGDRGFRAFAAELSAYLRTDAGSDLRRSLAAHVADMATEIAETQQAMVTALSLSDAALAGRLDRFRSALAAVDRQRAHTAAVTGEEFRRLQAETDRQARAVVTAEQPFLARLVAERAAASGGPASAVERDVLTAVGQRIRATVEAWRSERAREVQVAVRALDEELTARLAAEIDAVRLAAAAHFGIDMSATRQAEPLTVTGRLTYSFAPDPGPVDSLTSAVRTRLPVRLARPRIRAHAAHRAAELLDRHVGRCAAGFRAELTETRRRFQREMDRRFADGAGHLAQAIEAAAALRTAQSPGIAATRADAELRRQRACELLHLAEQLAVPAVCATGRTG